MNHAIAIGLVRFNCAIACVLRAFTLWLNAHELQKESN